MTLPQALYLPKPLSTFIKNLRTKQLVGFEFMSFEEAVKQGEKNVEVTVSFLFTKLKTKIEAWKKQFGDIYELKVKDKESYLKPLTLMVYKHIIPIILILEHMVDNTELILANCWIEEDKCIRKEDAYIISAIGVISTMIESFDVESSFKSFVVNFI